MHDSSPTYWALEAIRSYLYLQFLADVSRVRVKRESIHMSQLFFLLYYKCNSILSSQESCPAKSWPSASSSTLTSFTTLPPSATVIAWMISAFADTKQAGRSVTFVNLNVSRVLASRTKNRWRHRSMWSGMWAHGPVLLLASSAYQLMSQVEDSFNNRISSASITVIVVLLTILSGEHPASCSRDLNER